MSANILMLKSKRECVCTSESERASERASERRDGESESERARERESERERAHAGQVEMERKRVRRLLRTVCKRTQHAWTQHASSPPPADLDGPVVCWQPIRDRPVNE
jgi:hypothetical protein